MGIYKHTSWNTIALFVPTNDQVREMKAQGWQIDSVPISRQNPIDGSENRMETAPPLI